MYFVTLILAALFTVDIVYCVDISAIPQAQPDFNIGKYLGVWYDQGKIAPCSWSGSSEFTDWKLDFKYEGKKLVLVQNWRSGLQCVNIKSALTARQPGCFTVKDPIGGVYSGEEKVVATDYKRFSVTWGCTKRSVDRLNCSLPWLSIETRKVNPDPATYKVIDAVLNKVFGFGLDRTQRVQHGDPC